MARVRGVYFMCILLTESEQRKAYRGDGQADCDVDMCVAENECHDQQGQGQEEGVVAAQRDNAPSARVMTTAQPTTAGQTG